MPTGIEPHTVWENGWIFRIRPPLEAHRRRVIVLIHGWTGDEHSMDIFERQLPAADALLIPRGPIKASPEGFGWLPHDQSSWPTLSMFEPPSVALLKMIDTLSQDIGIANPQIALMGFSQGAALAFALAALFPARIDRVASLAGFMPTGITALTASGFTGKQFYIAHGAKDETIPVGEAHRIVEILRGAQAHVEYCESDAGHKLSAACFKGLAIFFAQP